MTTTGAAAGTLHRATLRTAAIALVALCTSAHAVQYAVQLVGGQPVYNEFGDFLSYNIFAEENAPMSPTPVFEVVDIQTRIRVRMAQLPPPVLPGSIKHDRYAYNSQNESRTLTATGTIDPYPTSTRTVQVPQYGYMTWHVRSAPFGALSAVGPHRFYADDNSLFSIAGLRFRTAGRYDVQFNTTFLAGQTFKFNRTIFVQRQPSAIVHRTTVVGFNGSAFSPMPTGQLVDFIGQSVASPTAQVTLDFQVVPQGAQVRGTLVRFTSNAGEVRFTDVIPTLPGRYTFRMVALLSSGQTITTPSQQVNVERALPIEILVLQSISGIARFQFYTQPIFAIRDSAGPSQDPRQNLTLSIINNKPDFSYEGGLAAATMTGVVTRPPVNYTYTFTDVAIDLPGTYIIEASMTLVTGANLTKQIVVRLGNPPTFEIPQPFTVNNPGLVTLHGERPQVATVRIRLGVEEDCTTPSSDIAEWPAGAGNGQQFNLTLVPFQDRPSYVCMSIPSHPSFAPLVQLYLPQYDELFPLVLTFPVATVSTCSPLPALDAAKYRAAGWESAVALRRYGCNLRPPVAGTIPACTCPNPLRCDSFRHRSFQPPELDIGQCICCDPWVLALAGTFPSLFFAGLLYVIYMYV